MLIAMIVACEIAFWVFIISGLVCRYLLRRPKLGAALLAASPLADLVLLTVTFVDLRTGGTATFAHTLAALYLGFSLVYGRRLVRWADNWAAYWADHAPRPPRRSGRAYAKDCWADVGRTLLSVSIAGALISALIWSATNTEAAQALHDSWRILGIVLAIDFFWAVSYTIWPRKPTA